MFISTDTTGCGNMWKATNTSDTRGKTGNLQIHKARAFVAWQREDGCVHVRMHMLLVELLIEALHGPFWGVVVLAEMAQHDVFHARMIDVGYKPRRFLVAQMTKGA